MSMGMCIRQVFIHDEEFQAALASDKVVELVRHAAPTLRTLAVISGGGLGLPDVREMLLDAGRQLHHLSLFMPDLCELQGRGPSSGGRPVAVLQPLTLPMATAHARQDDPRLYASLYPQVADAPFTPRFVRGARRQGRPRARITPLALLAPPR